MSQDTVMDIVDTFNTGLMTWRFSYTENAHFAWLTSDLSPDDRFPVIDGYAVMGRDLLIPSINEDDPMYQWLLRCWQDATSTNEQNRFYRDADTTFDTSGKHGFLTNDHCPLCLKRRREFELHHVIFKSDGGHDSVQNLLRICRSCHALINNGCVEDGVPRAMAAFLHQLFQFGIIFLPVTPPGKGKFKDVHPLDRLPHLYYIIDSYTTLQHRFGTVHASQYLQRVARVMYKFFIGVICGDILWDRYAWKDERVMNS